MATHQRPLVLALLGFAACSGEVTEPGHEGTAVQGQTWYRDADGDGYGDPGSSVESPTQPAGYVANDGDADDGNAAVFPGAPELCDGLDNDGNGAIDDGAGCQPEVLVSTPGPWFLAADADRVFISARSWNMQGGISVVGKDGSGYAQLATANDPRGIAVDASRVYFAVDDGLAMMNKDGSGFGYLFQVPTPPPPDPTNMCLHPFWESVALDGQRAYLTGSGPTCAPVVRVSLDGSGASPMPLAGDGLGEGLALDASDVFITRPLQRAPKDASQPSEWTQLSTSFSAEGVAVDASHVYWIEDFALHEAAKDGTGKTTLASWSDCSALYYPFNVVVNAAHVYWIEGCSDTLRRVDLDGQNETVIDGGGNLLSVIADEGAIYWTAQAANEVRRLRVPHDAATGAALP